jgi:hypothetical protein
LKVFVIVAVFLMFACAVNADEDLLSRIPQLQRTAQAAVSGGLGCGSGEVEFHTSTGVRTVVTGLDPIHVFGSKIHTGDLVLLLATRVESNRSGVDGPMSANLDSLCYVIISTLALSHEPLAIEPLLELLNDSSPMVRRWSAIALYEMGEASTELREVIRETGFPMAVVADAASHGNKRPEWVKVRK